MSIDRTHRNILSPIFIFGLIGTLSSPAFCEATGKEMWVARCSPCHSIEPPPKLAPPVRGIVMNYKRTYSDREAFAAAVSSFVHTPTKEASQMPHALEKFNLMPALPFEKSELAEIAGWMWDTIVSP